MKLTPTERQTLLGPLVAGCVLGAAVALAVLGFDSEYRHLTPGQMALNACVAFVASVAIAVVPLGLLPIAVRRLRQRLAVRSRQPR